MQFVIFRLIAYIPAPIMFGSVIDSTCLLWKSSCGEKGGRCLIYDIEAFRFRWAVIFSGFSTTLAIAKKRGWNRFLKIGYRLEVKFYTFLWKMDIFGNYNLIAKEHMIVCLYFSIRWLPLQISSKKYIVMPCLPKVVSKRQVYSCLSCWPMTV